MKSTPIANKPLFWALVVISFGLMALAILRLKGLL